MNDILTFILVLLVGVYVGMMLCNLWWLHLVHVAAAQYGLQTIYGF